MPKGRVTVPSRVRKFAAPPFAMLFACLLVALPGGALPAGAASATPIQIYGAWHCSNDACLWGSVRTEADFDAANHWLIDRGDGRPSVNLVVLSFVQPFKLLNATTDASTLNGVARGMTPAIVKYFTSHGIRVMLSIGGITYVDAWNQALAQNAARLGHRAATVAKNLGVGIEIDYEANSNASIAGLQAFINAYRADLPYDATGSNPAARLTIDLAAGDRWLIDIGRKATTDWLNPSHPVLDDANAMVPARQPSTSSAEANWQEHIDGKPQYSPPISPLAPAKFTGSVFFAEGKQVRPECVDDPASLQSSTATFVRTVAGKVGTTSGMLGYMFWAAERPSTRGVTTAPPNTCEGGVGAGATRLQIPLPMPALRQG
jgi:hypothetical protein